MFALLKLYYVCPLNTISKNDHGTYSAKFKDGAYYDVDVVATHFSSDVLENVKHSLRSNHSRIVLSRCDENTSLNFEQNKEFKLDVSADIVKQEIPAEEEDEQTSNFIDDHVNSDSFTRNGSFNETSCNENLSAECLNSNALAREESAIVTDAVLENPFNSNAVFYNDNYSLWSTTDDTKFPVNDPPSLEKSKKDLLLEINNLEDSQNSLQGNGSKFDDRDYKVTESDSEENLYCHSSFPEKTIENYQTDNNYEDPASFQISYINSPDCNIIHAETNTNSSSVPKKSNVPSHEELFIYDNKGENKVPENITYRIHNKACKVLKKHVFPSLKKSECGKSIQYDNLGIAYGNFICAKYPHNKYYSTIRTRLGLIGKLLMETRRLDPTITDFASLIIPSRVELIIQAINHIAGLDRNGVCRAPTTANSLKYICKDAAEVLRKKCAKNNDSECSQQVDAFLKLFKRLANLTIHKRVLRKRKIETPNRKHKKSRIILKARTETLCKKNDEEEGSTLDSCSANTNKNCINTKPDLNNIIDEKVFKKELNSESDHFKRTTYAVSDIPEYSSDNHQYPVYIPKEEDNISDINEITANTSSKVQKGNTPLPEADMQFNNQKVENKIPVSAENKKRNFCVYCKKLYARLPRHLARVHPEEKAVKLPRPLPKVLNMDYRNTQRTLTRIIQECGRLIQSENFQEASDKLTLCRHNLIRIQHMVSTENYTVLNNSMNSLQNTCLNNLNRSSVTESNSHLAVSADRLLTGDRGRPAVVIPREQLLMLYENGYTASRIAKHFACSRSVVYKRCYEEGLKLRNRFNISDEVLKEKIENIHNRFPNAGSTMMMRYLRAEGIWVQRSRVRNTLSEIDTVGTARRLSAAFKR